MKKFIWSALVACCCLTSVAAQAQAQLVQVNISGAEFNASALPGALWSNYVFPSSTELAGWKAKGLKVFRMPVLWERLQPTLNGPLDSTYAGLIDQTLATAAKQGMTAIVDVHNYGYYRGNVLGSAAVPLSAYKDLTKKMATRWAKNPGLYGYDIMNEPHDAANLIWPTAAQYAIDGIRGVDKIKPIIVEGASWSNAQNWPLLNGGLLLLRDPSKNLIFSAHLYVDADTSGTYQTTLTTSNFDTNIGVTRATPFVTWLNRNHLKGQIGEFGIPGSSALALQSMDKLMAFLKTNCVPLAYWSSGAWWGSYPLSIEPDTSGDKPQWGVLKKYASATNNCK